MKLIIAAGGTGGHIYPGIAIAEEFLKRNPENKILFIGSYDGLEKDLVPKEGFRIRLIFARGLLRKISWKSISAPFITFIGFIQTLFFFLFNRPDYLILTGGYVSFPVAISAKILGIKLLLCEQNVLPGFVNRVLSKIVNVTILSFEESLQFIKGEVLGNPVRKRIREAPKWKSSKKRILIMGGSQGALRLNQEVIENLFKFKDSNIDIIHLVGARDYSAMIDRKSFSGYPFYYPISYLYNVEKELCKADLVVSRAGATAIAEFLILGIPSILIPFPYSAEGHQDFNADVIEKHGAGIALKEKYIEKLSDIITGIIKDETRLFEMSKAALNLAKPNAAKEIVDIVTLNHSEYSC